MGRTYEQSFCSLIALHGSSIYCVLHCFQSMGIRRINRLSSKGTFNVEIRGSEGLNYRVRVVKGPH